MVGFEVQGDRREERSIVVRLEFAIAVIRLTAVLHQ